MKGLSPKAWYYALTSHLWKKREAVATILTGSSNEQWFNAELLLCIAKYLNQWRNQPLTVYTEYKKVDLTIGTIDDENSFEKLFAFI